MSFGKLSFIHQYIFGTDVSFVVVKALLISFLLLTGVVQAQIVNIENQRLQAKENGWLGSIGLNMSYIKNTREIWQIGSRVRVQYHQDKHTALWLSELNFVKAGQSDFLNNGFEHLRYNYALTDSGRLVVEAFRQMQYNKVQKIKLRSLFGAGFRYRVVDRDSAQVDVGVHPMYEFEELSNEESNRHFRLSSYLSFDFQFNANLGINSITYYQPDVANFKDFRLSNETTLRTKITEKLDLRIIFRLTYDEEPPEGVPQNTVYLKNGIVFRF